MKFTKTKDRKSTIDKEIERVTLIISLLNPTSEAYTKANANLTQLKEGKSKDKDTTKVSKDVIVTGLFSVVTVVIIVGYEFGHVLGSKALGFVIKGRV